MATVVQTRFNTDLNPTAVDEADRTRPMTAQETEWKQRIYEHLLTVLDLSLIDTVETDKARKEIREIVERLLIEASAPLSRKQRQLIVERIEDEVMGLVISSCWKSAFRMSRSPMKSAFIENELPLSSIAFRKMQRSGFVTCGKRFSSMS